MSAPPKGTPAVSSKRARSSPEVSLRAPKKPQASKDMETQEIINAPGFMSTLKETMASLFDEKLAPLATMESVEILRNDILSLRQENETLKLKLASLERAYEDKFEEMEVRIRKNNVIIRGLKHEGTGSYEAAVKRFFLEVLKVELKEDRMQALPLGHKDKSTRPILVSFSLFQDKIDVLKATKILRGTGITIQADLPTSVRAKQKKLLIIRREILSNNAKYPVRVRGNLLLLNNHKFSWSMEDGLLYDGHPGAQRLSDLMGVDMSTFLKDLLTGSLPADYFETKLSSSRRNGKGSHDFISSKDNSA